MQVNKYILFTKLLLWLLHISMRQEKADTMPDKQVKQFSYSILIELKEKWEKLVKTTLMEGFIIK